MYHEIDAIRHCSIQRALEIGKEIVSATPANNSWPKGHIEAEVGIR